MANVQARARALALRTALSLRAASVQWHPAQMRVASIAAALGGDRWRACKYEREPLPSALHSRSKQRACSGTLRRCGWHRSPPLRAEIDGERASASESPCPLHCTLAQSSERAVAPSRFTTARVASIAAALGGDRWRTCRSARLIYNRRPLPTALHSRSKQRACRSARLIYNRRPLPAALHSRSEQRACSGTLSIHNRPLLPFALHSRSEPRACSGTLLIHNCAGGIDRRRSA